jgi:phage protein D
MNMMTERHTAGTAPGAVVRIGTPGGEVRWVLEALIEVSADCARSGASTAMLRLRARGTGDGRWPVQDAKAFAPWTPVTVAVAFDRRIETLVCGYVRELHADYPADLGAATVTVVVQDRTIALDREHRRRAWRSESPTTDLDLVSRIVGQHPGITLHPDSGRGLSHRCVLQDSTDIRFLRERAAANGYECYLAADTLYFGPPRIRAPAQRVLLVAAGAASTCLRFTVAADGHRPDAVAVGYATDPSGTGTECVVRPDLPLLGAEPAGSEAAGLDAFVWRLRPLPATDEAELSARARGTANEQALRVRAVARIDGGRYGHVLRPGEPVTVDGVGRRFSGRYYVDGVTHRLRAEGYEQSAVLLRNAYGEHSANGR